MNMARRPCIETSEDVRVGLIDSLSEKKKGSGGLPRILGHVKQQPDAQATRERPCVRQNCEDSFCLMMRIPKRFIRSPPRKYKEIYSPEAMSI